MHRPIKFRGKSVHNNEWVYGNFIHSKRFEGCGNEFRIHNQDTGLESDVNPETVGQFTGLLDKNGKEIFEGDYILYSNSIERGKGFVTFNRGFNIDWQLNTVVSDKPSLIDPLFYFGCSSEIEVIGNIHDNQKLLKP